MDSLTTLLIPRPIEKTYDIEISKVTLHSHVKTRRKRRQTYHRSNDGIVIFVQLPTSGQPRSQTAANEADGDEGEDDGDDGEVDAAAVELVVSGVNDGHHCQLLFGVRGFGFIAGVVVSVLGRRKVRR